MKRRKDKKREESSDQKRKEGRGEGTTSGIRAFGVRACRLAVLFCSHYVREKNKTNGREVKRKKRKRSEGKK